ncbi:Cytochrome P450 [Rasamsonia emersonii CBS 393.64]|uniref:Cytochrome P450 n=1 Tax=Rasamsonia emersonii (strain ATCC 16479 / CBS 393.64 / IMI 116815) TaxID=1408163 RepID=A0A0F4YZI0_RASE3|nr:Cytochrome P450 [Rasamsonia emersonii CBS 393.64]KKA23236.1 Cytochrome P450 [Rasamsonia emersonii CBS 393.64]
MATSCASRPTSSPSPPTQLGKPSMGSGRRRWARTRCFRCTRRRGCRANNQQDILTADRQTHIRQRRLLSHAFSEKALREQESILQTYVDKLLEQVSARCASGAVDLVAWYNFATYDLIGDLSFGEQFGCLDKGEYDPFVRSIKAIAKELTFMQMLKYYGLLGVRQFFLPKAVVGARAQNMQRAMNTVDRRVQRQTDRKDFLYYILAANDEKGMSRAEINVNAFSLSIAGSESTATLLAGATFYILTHRDVYERLTTEIRTTFASEDDIRLSSINNLEYLDAVLTETLRIYPPVAVTLPRVVPDTPAGGEDIDGSFVPVGTTVGVNHFACFRHPANFHQADSFLPERWLPDRRDQNPFDRDNRACLQPFSYGPRNCLGKNLARAEMRLILARMLWRFDLELDETMTSSSSSISAWHDSQRVFGFWLKPPLMCRVTPVDRKE